MAKKTQLREIRKNTQINLTSKQQESNLHQSIIKLVNYLEEKYDIIWKKTIKNTVIVEEMKKSGYENISCEKDNTNIKPDGGILYVKYKEEKYPILICEVKNQGTNDKRLEEGNKKQAQGNAIERLGKNVIGLKNYMLNYDIFPFVCFGYGCDFEEGSSIRDRVKTISGYIPFNKVHLYKYNGDDRCVGSFFFRSEEWSIEEMFSVLKEISERSINYYEENIFK
ncbi:MAG: EcoRI family type II restriction endonuclease [bacterium]